MTKRNIFCFGRIDKKGERGQKDIQRNFSQKYDGMKKCDKNGSWQGRSPFEGKKKVCFLPKKREKARKIGKRRKKRGIFIMKSTQCLYDNIRAKTMLETVGILTEKRQQCKVGLSKKTRNTQNQQAVCYFFGSIFRIQSIEKNKGFFAIHRSMERTFSGRIEKRSWLKAREFG